MPGRKLCGKDELLLMLMKGGVGGGGRGGHLFGTLE